MIIGIDPGEKRTGVAMWLPACNTVKCYTLDPWAAVRFVDSFIWPGVEVVAEKWVLYPEIQGNAWRELIEAKALGALQYLCETRGVTYTEQPTSILVPTQALADSRGYEWAAMDRDQKSAETHIYYYQHLKGKS